MFYRPENNDHGLPFSPFKSCAVPRVIGWLSTLSPDGVANLAPYSQFTNLTFDPPYVLVAINQTIEQQRKDTTVNIEQTGEFVYNMVTYDLREKMNITAAAFPPDVDEFERAGLTKAPSVVVKPWRIAESPIQMECVYVQTIRLPGEGLVGTSDIIIGKVVGVRKPGSGWKALQAPSPNNKRQQTQTWFPASLPEAVAAHRQAGLFKRRAGE